VNNSKERFSHRYNATTSEQGNWHTSHGIFHWVLTLEPYWLLARFAALENRDDFGICVTRYYPQMILFLPQGFVKFRSLSDCAWEWSALAFLAAGIANRSPTRSRAPRRSVLIAHQRF